MQTERPGFLYDPANGILGVLYAQRHILDRRRRALLVSAVLAAAIVLGGCTGDTPDDAAADSGRAADGDSTAGRGGAADDGEAEGDASGDSGDRDGGAAPGAPDGAVPERGPLRVVEPNRRATRLAERAGGGLFAHFERLNHVHLYELVLEEEGHASVRDRSSDISPGWGSFQGSEFANLRHARRADQHVFVVDENRAGGQRMVVFSDDDGESFAQVMVGGQDCPAE